MPDLTPEPLSDAELDRHRLVLKEMAQYNDTEPEAGSGIAEALRAIATIDHLKGVIDRLLNEIDRLSPNTEVERLSMDPPSIHVPLRAYCAECSWHTGHDPQCPNWSQPDPDPTNRELLVRVLADAIDTWFGADAVLGALTDAGYQIVPKVELEGLRTVKGAADVTRACLRRYFSTTGSGEMVVQVSQDLMAAADSLADALQALDKENG